MPRNRRTSSAADPSPQPKPPPGDTQTRWFLRVVAAVLFGRCCFIPDNAVWFLLTGTVLILLAHGLSPESIVALVKSMRK